MNRTNFRAVALGAALLCVSACRNTSSETAPLSVDRKAGSVAAAEVTASNGPVELTLRLKDKTVARERSLWYQVRLKNIGMKKMPVRDAVFWNPSVLDRQGADHEGAVRLEIFDSSGTERTPFPRREIDVPPPPSPEDVRSMKKRLALIESWQKAGLSPLQISINLSNYLNGESQKAEADVVPPTIWLEQGASTATAPWAYQSSVDIRMGKPAPSPAGDFAEFRLYGYMLAPGRYRARLVYDMAVSKELQDRFHLPPPDPWCVRVETPSIDFEISP